MIVYSVNTLEKLLKEKNWNLSDLTREYGKLEAPELSADDAIKKYGSSIRKAVRDPDHTSHGTIKKLIEILGARLVVKVERTDELPL